MTTSERPEHSGRWTSKAADVQAAMAGFTPLPDPLPILLCKGLCADSCGPAPMTPVEIGRVERAIDRPLVVHSDSLTCSALNSDGRCDAYSVRPFICRAWGMSEGMMCPHGCVTTNGEYLTYPEVMGLAAKLQEVEGPLEVPPVVNS